MSAQKHRRALVRKGERDRATDAAARAGDDRPLAGESPGSAHRAV